MYTSHLHQDSNACINLRTWLTQFVPKLIPLFLTDAIWVLLESSNNISPLLSLTHVSPLVMPASNSLTPWQHHTYALYHTAMVAKTQIIHLPEADNHTITPKLLIDWPGVWRCKGRHCWILSLKLSFVILYTTASVTFPVNKQVHHQEWPWKN